jgi:hypothetical protein
MQLPFLSLSGFLVWDVALCLLILSSSNALLKTLFTWLLALLFSRRRQQPRECSAAITHTKKGCTKHSKAARHLDVEQGEELLDKVMQCAQSAAHSSAPPAPLLLRTGWWATRADRLAGGCTALTACTASNAQGDTLSLSPGQCWYVRWSSAAFFNSSILSLLGANRQSH